MSSSPNPRKRPRPDNLEPPEFGDGLWNDTDDRTTDYLPYDVKEFVRRHLGGLLGGGNGRGQVPSNMLLANMKIDNIGEGGSWKGERVLGAGSYGTVALFEYRDLKTGELLDQMAIKQQARDPDVDVVFNGREDLCEEAGKLF